MWSRRWRRAGRTPAASAAPSGRGPAGGRRDRPSTRSAARPPTACRPVPCRGRRVGPAALDRGVPPVPEARPQLPAAHLPAGGTRERPRRQRQYAYVVVAEVLPQPAGCRAQHRCGGGGLGACPLHERDDPFAPAVRVRGPHDRHGPGRQPRRRRDRRLQVRRMERTAVDEHHVLVAPGDAQPSVPQEAEIGYAASRRRRTPTRSPRAPGGARVPTAGPAPVHARPAARLPGLGTRR